MYHFRSLVTLILVLVLIPAYSAQASAPLPQNGSENEFLQMDAEEYASVMGVGLEEAQQRLSFQAEIGNINERLLKEAGDLYGGIVIEHQPNYRVVLQATKDADALVGKFTQQSSFATYVEPRTVVATLLELENARAKGAKIAEDLGIQVTSGVDVAKNKAILYVLSKDRLIDAINRKGLRLPESLLVEEVQDLPTKTTILYGGVALTSPICTPPMVYAGITLTTGDRVLSNGRDIQWGYSTRSTDTVSPIFYDGRGTRSVTAKKYIQNMVVGEWVCKYGRATGHSCGTINILYFDSVNVVVKGTVVQPGDSGGPWFYNNTAYGTTISNVTFKDGTMGSCFGPINTIERMNRGYVRILIQ